MQLSKGKTKFSEFSNIFKNNQISDKLVDTFDLFKTKRLSNEFTGIKSKGVKLKDTFLILLILPFLKITSVYAIYKSNFKGITKSGKDVFYDFKNNSLINWRKIIYIFVKIFIRKVAQKGEASKNAVKCLIVDDSILKKTGEKIEHVSYVHDHTTNRWVLGFKILTLGFWDGKSFLGIDFSLQKETVKSDKKRLKKILNRIKKLGFRKKRDRKSFGKKREIELTNSKIDNALSMIKRAVKNGIIPDYVLSDSWFVSEKFIKTIRSLKKGVIHVLGMVRQDNRKYLLNGKYYTAKALIAKYKCMAKISRKLRMQYYPIYCEYKGMKIKLFLVKQGFGQSGKWKLILSTDTNISFIRAIKTYNIRWTIEVFFKEQKQYFNLGKSQSNDFDAQIADASISFIQNIMLSLMLRFSDYETKGELFKQSQQGLITQTIAVRIWEFVLELLKEILEILEVDINDLISKIINHRKTEKKMIKMLFALKTVK